MSRIAENFDGKTFNVNRDQVRLNAQLDLVRTYLFRNRGWHTLDEIGSAVGAPPASVSARLRDLRKTKFGGYDIQRRLRGTAKGLYEYHLEFPDPHEANKVTLGNALLAGACVCIIYFAFLLGPALGHDFMLNGTRSPTGEWCCGAEDCGLVDPKAVHAVKGGYSVVGTVTYGAVVTGNKLDGPTTTDQVNETIPYSQALPSPNGAFWRCKRPDGTPRCFFAPPPGS